MPLHLTTTAKVAKRAGGLAKTREMLRRIEQSSKRQPGDSSLNLRTQGYQG